jgi:protein ImuB
VAVGLEARPVRPAKQQFHLFETPLRDPSRLHETLTRLTGLLGRVRVGRPVREDSHRPDAFRVEPFAWELPDSPSESGMMIGPALRRLRLGPLVVAGGGDPGGGILSAPEFSPRMRPQSAIPAEVTAPGYNQSAVVARQGPYLASGDWWDTKKWQRTEWDLELANGALCCGEKRGEEWRLDGIYD